MSNFLLHYDFRRIISAPQTNHCRACGVSSRQGRKRKWVNLDGCRVSISDSPGVLPRTLIYGSGLTKLTSDLLLLGAVRQLWKVVPSGLSPSLPHGLRQPRVRVRYVVVYQVVTNANRINPSCHGPENVMRLSCQPYMHTISKLYTVHYLSLFSEHKWKNFRPHRWGVH